MKKIYIVLVLMVFVVFSCESKDDDVDINIRVKNSSDVIYTNVQLYGYTPSYLQYYNIAPNEVSQYVSYESRKKPDLYRVITPTDTLVVVYEFLPIDGGLKNGFYTLSFNNRDLTINFNKD